MGTSAEICVGYSPQPRLREYLVNKVSPIHARILDFIIPPPESLEGFSLAKKFGRGCLSGITAIAAVITYLVLGLLGIAPIGLAIAGDEAVKAIIDHNNKKFAESLVRPLAESSLPKSQQVHAEVALIQSKGQYARPVEVLEVDSRIVRRCDVPVISNQHSDSQYEARPTSPPEEPVETILARFQEQYQAIEAVSSQRAQTTTSIAAICKPKKLGFTENLTKYFRILEGVLEDQIREIDQRPVREIQRRESAPDILKAR
jgi:hypothetical protein